MGRLWLRSSADYPWRTLWRGLSLPKALGIAWIGRGFAAKARQAGFAVNDGFSGFSDFNPQHDYARIFERSLAAPGKRHLVMCHPGHVDDELRALDPTTITREQELAFLLSSDFSAILQKHQAKLVRFALSEPPSHTSRPHIPN